MQLVSLDQLLKLADKKLISESEREFDYDEFKAVHSEYYKNLGNASDAFYEIVCKYLYQFIPPIEFVAEGSSRSVFALRGGKCLKIALNEKGIAQNRAEVDTVVKSNLPCFAKVYDHADDFTSLLTECCVCMSEPHVEKRVFSMGMFPKEVEIENWLQFRGTIWCAHENKYNLVTAMRQAQNVVRQYSMRRVNFGEALYKQNNKVYMQFFKSMIQNRHPVSRYMRMLFQYCRTHRGELAVGDLMHIANWGIAVREGRLMPVVIDAGLSEDIFAKYYKEENKNQEEA